MPSKKFIIATLAVLFLIAGIFWVVKNGKPKEKTIFQKKDSLISAFLQQNRKDSDNDGLMDWEEVLWKTDLNNPDTDKDGTLDGEEVKLGRNPAMAGPDDFYSPENFSSETSTSSEPLSETEKFSRDFISQYLAAKQIAGGNLDETTKQGLLNSLEKNIDTSIPPPVFKISDIKISTDNSKQAIKNYANQLSAILMKYVNPPPSAEIYIFKEMADKKDQSWVEELKKNVLTYEGLKKDCLDLAVPSELKIQHLNLVNSFALLKGITEKFQNYFTDPLGSFVALQQYSTASTDLADSIIQIRNYLKNKDVPFNF